MNRTLRILAFAAAVLLSCSCVKEQLELEYSKQEEQIDRYITNLLDRNETYTVTHHKGSNRVTMTEGTGEPLAAGGTVTFHYAAYIFNGNVSAGNLIGTNHKETAEKTGWNTTDNNFSPYTVNLGDKKLIKGLKNGLEGVRKGEECEIVFSAKYGFGNKHNNVVPKNQALLYHIWVDEVAE